MPDFKKIIKNNVIVKAHVKAADNVVKKMIKYDNLLESEKSYIKKNKINLSIVFLCGNIATRETKFRFGQSWTNDKSDAFRHCLWTALICKYTTYHAAIRFTSMNEMRIGNPICEKIMDLHNNKVGAKIGDRGGTDHDLAEACMRALKENKLTVINYSL